MCSPETRSLFLISLIPSNTDSCPNEMDTWTSGRHIACYKMIDDISLSWREAMEYCQRHYPQSHLFDVQTADEYKAITNNIPLDKG